MNAFKIGNLVVLKKGNNCISFLMLKVSLDNISIRTKYILCFSLLGTRSKDLHHKYISSLSTYSSSIIFELASNVIYIERGSSMDTELPLATNLRC